MKKIFTILCSIICFYGLWAANILAEEPTVDDDPNQPSYLKLIPPDKLKEDLDFLFKTIEEVHPNMYAYTSKEEFVPLRDELYRQINRPVNRLDFYKLVAPVVAKLKNGHTMISPPFEDFMKYIQESGTVFPLAIHWSDQKVILADNYGSMPLPVGGTILRINGEAAHELIARFARCFPGECKETNHWVLEDHMILWCCLWFEYGPAESLTLQIKSIDGQVKNYTVKSLPLNKFKRQAVKYGWQPELIPEHNAYLIRFDFFSYHWMEYIEETFGKIQRKKISNLILDIRKNPGGSSVPGDALLKYLTNKPFRQFEQEKIKISSQALAQSRVPKELQMRETGSLVAVEQPFIQPEENSYRFTGRIFVLISRQSASSSMSFAAAIKCFDVGTLIGEETGDATVDYGESIPIKLPNSDLQVMIACKQFTVVCGKSDCRGVIPYYEVRQKPEDTAKGIDTVMEFTLNLIKNNEAKE